MKRSYYRLEYSYINGDYTYWFKERFLTLEDLKNYVKLKINENSISKFGTIYYYDLKGKKTTLYIKAFNLLDEK